MHGPLEILSGGCTNDCVSSIFDLLAPLLAVELGIEILRLDHARDAAEDLLSSLAIEAHWLLGRAFQSMGREPSPTIVKPAQ